MEMAGNGPAFEKGRTAPWYSIPPQEFISVEHPCIVNDVEKGIETLDGASGISGLLNSSHRDTSATLLLNPEDAMSRPLRSTSKSTNNILLKLTVPRRTGRRRKRGTQDPFVEAEEDTPATAAGAPNSQHILQRLRENVGRYQIDVVGRVERTHVFRGLPDFVYSTTASPFVTKFRENVLPFDYGKLKNFQLDMSKGAISNVDVVPPPSLSTKDVPFQYMYRQNPTVKQSVDPSGEVTTINTQQAMRVMAHLVAYDVPSVPTKPRDNCPPISIQDQPVLDTVAALNVLFSERPGWPRRGLRNALPTPERKYALRLAIPYVGYIFRSGPWRDAIFRFGYDPRTTPDSRIYQTLMFRIFPGPGDHDSRDDQSEAPSTATATTATTTTPLSNRRQTLPRPSYDLGDPSAPQTSHLFTGQPPLSRDGKMWMITDITDPILVRLLSPSSPDSHPPRPVCDNYAFGWYGNVTLAITRAVMRTKIQAMLEHRTDMLRDEDVLPLFKLPNHVEGDEEISRIFNHEYLGPQQLVSETRTILRNGPWKQERRKERQQGATSAAGRSGKRVKWEDEERAEEEGEGEEGEEEGEEGEEEEFGEEEEAERQEQDIVDFEQPGDRGRDGDDSIVH